MHYEHFSSVSHNSHPVPHSISLNNLNYILNKNGKKLSLLSHSEFEGAYELF